MIKKGILFLCIVLFGFELQSSFGEGGSKKNSLSICLEHLKFLDGNKDAKKRYWGEQKLWWLCNTSSDSDSGSDEDSDANDFSSMASGHSELFGFLKKDDKKTTSQEYLKKIQSIFKVGTSQQSYLIYAAFMGCKTDIEKEGDRYKDFVDDSMTRLGLESVRANFCTSIDNQIVVLQKAKTFYDEKSNKNPGERYYGIGEIERKTLRSCLAAMASLYWLDTNY